MRMTIEPWRVRAMRPCDDFCESVFFVGNGALGVRGYWEQQRKPDPQAHASFRAGLFEEIKPGVTDMVQLPDALGLLLEGDTPEALEQTLDLRRGVLTHAWANARAEVRVERMASMAEPWLLCQRMRLTACQAGEFTVRAVADSRVVNLPVHDDQTVRNTETVPLLVLDELTETAMRLHTCASGKPVALRWELAASRPCERRAELTDGRSETVLHFALDAGETVVIDQRVWVLARGDEPGVASADPWGDHERAWAALWQDCDVELDGDDELQGALRYNIYQMLCNNAANDPTVSIGARGLTHGRYKGNTFWDTDIFLFPFYLWQRPEAARSLAQYRVDRLADAKRLAQKQSLAGARYPWMCSDTGLEQCESWDIGQCEVHITGDVVYALERYGEVTGDEAFMRQVRPVYAETARYWRSRLTYEPDKEQYSLFFVKGPDEYCGATINNAYTNYLARRNLRLAAERGGVPPEEAAELRAIADRIPILYDERRDLFLQDETFFRLEPAPFIKEGETPLYKQVCYDRMQRYRVLKQADLVQLMVLFPGEFTQAQKANVFDTYEPLTLHDSTLSYGIHALLAFQLGREAKAMDYLRRSALLDLRDGMRNTGHEGIHVAALGATWQAVVFGMAGLWAENGELTVSPHLPEAIRRLRLRVRHRGKPVSITITHEETQVEEG